MVNRLSDRAEAAIGRITKGIAVVRADQFERFKAEIREIVVDEIAEVMTNVEIGLRDNETEKDLDKRIFDIAWERIDLRLEKEEQQIINKILGEYDGNE